MWIQVSLCVHREFLDYTARPYLKTKQTKKKKKNSINTFKSYVYISMCWHVHKSSPQKPIPMPQSCFSGTGTSSTTVAGLSHSFVVPLTFKPPPFPSTSVIAHSCHSCCSFFHPLSTVHQPHFCHSTHMTQGQWPTPTLTLSSPTYSTRHSTEQSTSTSCAPGSLSHPMCAIWPFTASVVITYSFLLL